MKKYSYEFQITGKSSNKGEFSDSGGGAMRISEDKDMNGTVQAELIRGAMDFFMAVTLPKEKYEEITEISVVVTNIKCIG